MRTVLLITCIGSMMAPLDSTIVSVSIPKISSDLGMSSETAIWIPTAYLVSLAVLLLTIGRISDLKGRKRIFILGFGIFVLGSFLCSVAQDGSELILFRILQGSGAACISATATAIVTETFPPEERGKALGVNAMAVYIGLTLGPALGGILTSAAGWRSIFYINIPIGIAVILLANHYFEEVGTRAKEEPLDIAGAGLFMIGLTSLLVLLTLGESNGWMSVSMLTLAAVSVIALLAFVRMELRRGERAMIQPSMFTRNRLFAMANVSALLNYAAYFSLSFVLSYYLQEVLGYSIMTAGLVLLIMPLTMAVISPLAGMASDRMGSTVLASAGMVVIGIGLLLFSSLSLSSGLIDIALYLMIVGIGMGLFSSPNTSAVMGSVERPLLGIASGTISTMRFVGQALSLAIMGAIMSSVAGSDFIVNLTAGTDGTLAASSFVDGMRSVFLAGAVIAFIGALTSSARGRPVPGKADGDARKSP